MRVDDIDLELRTMYVGMTRAEDILFAIKGEREECLLERETFGPRVQEADGIAVDPAFGDLYVSYFGQHSWRYHKIYSDIRRSDCLHLRRQGRAIKIYKDNYYFGKLASPNRKPNGKMNLALQLDQHFREVRVFEGLEVTGVYRRYVEQDRRYDEKHDRSFFDDLCDEAKERGFYYVVEIGGVVRPQ